jgi:hypothetical protein
VSSPKVGPVRPFLYGEKMIEVSGYEEIVIAALVAGCFIEALKVG